MPTASIFFKIPCMENGDFSVFSNMEWTVDSFSSGIELFVYGVESEGNLYVPLYAAKEIPSIFFHHCTGDVHHLCNFNGSIQFLLLFWPHIWPHRQE